MQGPRSNEKLQTTPEKASFDESVEWSSRANIGWRINFTTEKRISRATAQKDANTSIRGKFGTNGSLRIWAKFCFQKGGFHFTGLQIVENVVLFTFYPPYSWLIRKWNRPLQKNVGFYKNKHMASKLHHGLQREPIAKSMRIEDSVIAGKNGEKIVHDWLGDGKTFSGEQTTFLAFPSL